MISSNNADFAWLVGLFEGEGCVSLQERNLTLTLAMRDRDVIERVARMWETRIDVQRNARGWAELYRVRLHGQRAFPWIEALFPYLSERRQTRVMDLLYRRGT